MSLIRLRVPATTANLGPGFDALGLALTLYNRVSVEIVEGPDIAVSVQGEGEGRIPKDGTNRFCVAMKRVYDRLGRPTPGLRVRMEVAIPLARGLGSSATAAVGGLVAANRLCGSPLSDADLIGLATDIEGHPDNAVPCLLGGFTAAAHADGQVSYVRALPGGPIRAVVAIPDFELETAKARAALPESVSLRDAVYNVTHTALVTLAFARGDFGVLRAAVRDRLHQPYRAPLIPGMERVFDAALSAGALGAAISGAGPALIAFVQDDAERVGEAMRRAWEKEGIASRALVLDVDTQGTVEE
ncbi:MAG: homoserine kinase [Candidatus Handelsmanbacteria bacterium RIFCSPLOWO2_12_FULL_64_10]|uniref:Homoserine kinase n=1 Tax=Handelsmanbacteria sp. (strain RIFCSPLOWO2_12_FULL_64_10) TaxID=1817868 RepID=A0A1F6C3K9_HANXR|nr:MAG: homoserine kinase [Candidatus Handelsmanbacteria bacterium RIFCSPLOWO2_12_FULL_64_10]